MTGGGHTRVFETLAQAARSDRLVVFAGAGISVPYGLPSWGSLVEGLGTSEPDPTDLPGEFSKFVSAYGARELSQLLEAKLGKRPTHVEESTRLLLELRSRAIVTTNCDRVIQTSAGQLGARLRPFVDDEDLAEFHSSPALKLIQLHGSLDRKESLTFTREQYDTLGERVPGLIRAVVELMTSCHVLFVGYSMADPDFGKLMESISAGHPERVNQLIGLFPKAEMGGNSWRRMFLDDKVRKNAPLLELPYEDFGESPTDGLTGFLATLREMVSPEVLPSLSRQCIVMTNGYTATLKTEATSYLANCLGVPLLATHRYGHCTSNGLLDEKLRHYRYGELSRDLETLLERGHSAVLDGTFADPGWRERIYELARMHDAHVIVLKTRCEDEDYIRARLWRRRLDHSRSEHEVVEFENFRRTQRDVMSKPLEEDPGWEAIGGEAVTFDNHGDRSVRTSEDASVDATTVADLIRIGPLMSVEI